VHGLTRQGRDFDVLAQALIAQAPERTVVCPDVVGRGQSDHLSNPADYQIPTYAADMLALLAQLKPRTLDWVGTSMGGLIGLLICGQPELPLPVPVRRLVLNDVGPVLEWASLQRIGEYLGQPLTFASVLEASDFLWSISASFGPHTPQAWLALSRHMVKPLADGSGRFALHYDPAIAQVFKAMTPEATAQSEALLWQLFDAVRASTLLIRGAESDLLSHATAQAMTQRGPKARLLEFAGVGHAPTFVAPEQVQVITDFLLA
jgi:pimeloyl-ACP methyl ester carboxylesterase